MSEDYKIAYENVMIANKMLEQENKQLKEEIKELNDNITWWTNRFKAVQRDYENLQKRIDKAIECIKNRNTTKSKKERFMSEETTLEKVLEILGDKEK